ncbi:hypothetical protein C6H66_08635 [Photorhabdus hindustanensis]|uniref:Uncharacterized protein n=1 Tax=Photorhabdus hindustanensis TaxID=2918802 RepID=A0A2S8Q3G5_9GAMM|nr:hypothetical protein C6H66_08635 [Photorhabdus hindustanensis]
MHNLFAFYSLKVHKLCIKILFGILNEIKKYFFLCITCVDFVKGGQQYLSSGCAAIFGNSHGINKNNIKKIL